MPRDLKEPDGCKFSSLRKILLLRLRSIHTICFSWGFGFGHTNHPAACESAADSMRGVWTHGQAAGADSCWVEVMFEACEVYELIGSIQRSM